MEIRRRRRGMVLLQTLVISVILSMISVMILKWVMGRYMMAARGYRSTVTTARTQGYAQDRFSTWGFATTSIPRRGNSTIDGKTVSFVTSGAGMQTIVFSSDEDQ